MGKDITYLLQFRNGGSFEACYTYLKKQKCTDEHSEKKIKKFEKKRGDLSMHLLSPSWIPQVTWKSAGSRPPRCLYIYWRNPGLWPHALYEDKAMYI